MAAAARILKRVRSRKLDAIKHANIIALLLRFLVKIRA